MKKCNRFSGGSQPGKEEGASHLARRVRNAEAFLNSLCFLIRTYAAKIMHPELKQAAGAIRQLCTDKAHLLFSISLSRPT